MFETYDIFVSPSAATPAFDVNRTHPETIDGVKLRIGKADYALGQRTGIQHTPTIYIVSNTQRGKPFVEVSGRKGLGVKADDLLDTLIDKARSEVSKRNTELAPAEQ